MAPVTLTPLTGPRTVWCDRCGWARGYGCPCILDPAALREAQAEVTRRHRMAVHRAAVTDAFAKLRRAA